MGFARAADDWQWRSPPACPSGEAMRRSLFRTIDPGAGMGLRVAVTVTDSPEGLWRARLSVERGMERHVEDLVGESCAAVSRASILVLAIFLDPQADLSALSEHPASDDSADDTPNSARDAPSPKAPIPARVEVSNSAPRLERQRLSAQKDQERGAGLALSGIASLGSLPGAALGVEALGTLQRAGLELRYGLRWFMTTTALAPGESERGAKFRLTVGTFGVCTFPIPKVRRLGACAGAEVGALQVDSYNLDLSRSPAVQAWVASEASLLARFPLAPPLAVGASAGLSIPLRRASYILETAEGEHTLHRAALVGARTAVSLECLF